jgi:hypothetical protein
VRLTAEDGYQAQRSYSIASAPEPEGTLARTLAGVAYLSYTERPGEF